MDWNEASNLIWERFCELDDNLQIDPVEYSEGGDVWIFPTKSFNSFCKRTFNDDFKKAAEAVVDGYTAYDFDLDQLWCLYDSSMKCFRTGDTPADFVDDIESFTADLLDMEDLLSQMEFSDEEIESFKKAYDEG